MKDRLPVFGNSYETSDGTAIRDYFYVSPVAEAHGLAWGSGRSESLNLGSGSDHSALEVIEWALQVTGKPISLQIEPARPWDSSCMIADATKARSVKGGRPNNRIYRQSSGRAGSGTCSIPKDTQRVIRWDFGGLSVLL